MKTLTFAALLGALIPSVGLGQGTVTFGSSTLQQRVIYIGGEGVVGANVTLWWSPDNIVAYTQLGGAIPTIAGGFVAPSELRTTGGATPEGGTAWFFVQATTAGGAAAETAPFQNSTGAPNGTPTPTPPATLDGWTYPLVIMPEPSTVMLVGLGLAGLLFSRLRRK